MQNYRRKKIKQIKQDWGYVYTSCLLEEILTLGIVWQDAVLEQKIKDLYGYISERLALPEHCGNIVDSYFVIEVNEF